VLNYRANKVNNFTISEELKNSTHFHRKNIDHFYSIKHESILSFRLKGSWGKMKYIISAKKTKIKRD